MFIIQEETERTAKTGETEWKAKTAETAKTEHLACQVIYNYTRYSS